MTLKSSIDLSRGPQGRIFQIKLLGDYSLNLLLGGHPVAGKLRWEIDMQIKKLDDQRRRHLHRSGAPQREGMLASNNKSSPSNFWSTHILFIIRRILLILYLFRIDISRLERRARGPGAPLADAKHRKTLTGILQIFFDKNDDGDKNGDAQRLNDQSDKEEMLLDDAQDSATQQQKNGRFESIGNLNSNG
uniref:Uncharacterized protein n=1 Tax=Romanomermis culicivorax TaxID=13658 RepID=A0A915JIU7_ROMCU